MPRTILLIADDAWPMPQRGGLAVALRPGVVRLPKAGDTVTLSRPDSGETVARVAGVWNASGRDDGGNPRHRYGLVLAGVAAADVPPGTAVRFADPTE